MIEYKVETCQEHLQEFIVAIDEAEQDLKIRKLCLKCLAKGYKKKVTLIKDSIYQVEQTKAHLSEDRQLQLQNNIKFLRILIENIEQLKDFYIQKIETIIEQVNKWVLQIQKMEEEFTNKILSHDQNDIKQFLSFIKQQQDIQLKEQPQFQNKIQDLLINMKEADLLNKCTNILLNINSISSVFEKNLINEDETNDNELNLQCEDHPQKRIILLDMGQESIYDKRLACENCIDNHPSLNYKSITYAHSQWKQILSKKQENMIKNLESMQQKVESIQQMLQQMQHSINQSFAASIQRLTSNYNQYQIHSNEIQSKMIFSWQKLSQEEIQKIAEELSKINQPSIYDDPLLNQYKIQDNQVNKIVHGILQSLQECLVTQFNQLNPFIKSQIFEKIHTQLQGTYFGLNQLVNTQKLIDYQPNFKEIHLQGQNQEIQQQKVKESLKEFTYLIIKESSIKQDQICSAVAFNKDCSIVAVGCDRQIKIFEFNQGKMKQIQLLSEHQNIVTTLNFMKKSNQLISGDFNDGQIIIWLMNQNNQWIYFQKLIGHSKGISCLILNNNEDLIISGSFDKTIKFWVKKNKWTCQQTITDHQKDVNALSLNEKQNRLISCSDDNYILIIGFSKNNLFTYQPHQKDQLHVNELNSSYGQQIKTKVVKVKFSQKDGQRLFPQQYIKQKCLLVNKNGQYINLMKKTQNGKFVMGQFIEYQTSFIFGCMRDDAEYLITWDDNSKEIQIRKYYEQ